MLGTPFWTWIHTGMLSCITRSLYCRHLTKIIAFRLLCSWIYLKLDKTMLLDIFFGCYNLFISYKPAVLTNATPVLDKDNVADGWRPTTLFIDIAMFNTRFTLLLKITPDEIIFLGSRYYRVVTHWQSIDNVKSNISWMQHDKLNC